MGISKAKELLAGIMKFGVKMEHPSGMVIIASGGVMFLRSL